MIILKLTNEFALNDWKNSTLLVIKTDVRTYHPWLVYPVKIGYFSLVRYCEGESLVFRQYSVNFFQTYSKTVSVENFSAIVLPFASAI